MLDLSNLAILIELNVYLAIGRVDMDFLGDEPIGKKLKCYDCNVTYINFGTLYYFKCVRCGKSTSYTMWRK